MPLLREFGCNPALRADDNTRRDRLDALKRIEQLRARVVPARLGLAVGGVAHPQVANFTMRPGWEGEP